jgi:hypothetical protein
MEDLRWIGFGSFFVVSLVIGVRLLLLARRTGEIPELLIGLAVLGIGPLGFGLSMLAFATLGRSTITSATLQGSAFVAVFIGSAAQCLFVWYVFRRQAAWAPPLVYAATALLATAYGADILENGLVDRQYGGVWFWSSVVLRLLVMAWCSVESLLYWSRMRRRLRFGLADPVVANRFLLWGVGSGAAFFGSALGFAVVALTGMSANQIPSLNLIVSLHGLLAAIAIWFAFQPPAVYVRWIEGRARPDGAAPLRPDRSAGLSRRP